MPYARVSSQPRPDRLYLLSLSLALFSPEFNGQLNVPLDPLRCSCPTFRPVSGIHRSDPTPWLALCTCACFQTTLSNPTSLSFKVANYIAPKQVSQVSGFRDLLEVLRGAFKPYCYPQECPEFEKTGAQFPYTEHLIL